MRINAAVLLLSFTAFTAGCGPDVVEEAPPVSNPYQGPLHIPVTQPDAEDVVARSGAAGRALECSGEPHLGGTGRDWDTTGGHGEPEDALADLVGGEFATLPPRGYHVEREEAERVLYSYDVAGQTKIAVIVADGVKDEEGNVGWGVETYAECDPAEWPDAVTDELGIQVWTDRTGNRVPITTVHSGPGPEHCEWQSITFLNIEKEQFVRDPEGVLESQEGPGLLKGRFDPDTTLPPDAKDTGYRLDGKRLWRAADGSAVYLVAGDKVERWPAAAEEIGCM